MDAILYWNNVALEASRTDFTPPATAPEQPPEQGGPTRTSRALAIVHIAMYNAYNLGATPYGVLPSLPLAPTNKRAAVAAAAVVTLTDLYPRQKATFQKELSAFLAMLTAADPAIANGIAWGRIAAQAILDARKDDGSKTDAAYTPSILPGAHRPDPLNPDQGFLGVEWGKVRPFLVQNLQSLRHAPPALNSPAYTTDFNEVKSVGAAARGPRTADQQRVGLFWGYDGARGIGVPPRLYNQVVRAISEKHGATEEKNALLFAAINVAMADAGIQAWDEKYHYNVWRPVVGIREADAGWGPSGLGDGNASTSGDAFWLPLGAPKTNEPDKLPFTPNFPAYPSGHATFGTAAFTTASKVLGVDPALFQFTFVSDELNGSSIDRDRSQRAQYSATLTINQAIEENAVSRIFLGVHWRFDANEGRKNGATIGDAAAAFPTPTTLP